MWKLAAGYLTGFNWYKYGIILALLLGWTVVVHTHATHGVELRFAKAETEEVRKHTDEILKKIDERIPVVQYREVESARDKAEIAVLKGELYDVLIRRVSNPACNLTDIERTGYNKLYSKTRKAAAK